MSPPPEAPPHQRSGFYPPAEADWHRMISEAAYFLAEKRGFADGHAVEDWLAAEASVKDMLSSDRLSV